VVNSRQKKRNGMKQALFLISLVLLACSDSQIGPITFKQINTPSASPSFPAEIVGVYLLDQVTLQGPNMDISYGVDPQVTVVYTHNDDITELVRGILFDNSTAIATRSNCLPSQLGISFDSNGRTSYACVGTNLEKIEMGYWNTTGYDNSLLAWSLFIYPQAIECEIVPFEINSYGLAGFVVFPLPKNGSQPFQENGNQQYRKIRIVLRKN
jgi:hypothetical protein